MQPKRLLLIEDNQGDVDLIRMRLLQHESEYNISYDVSYADRLSTGLAELAKERPAVVLLDLYLPDSSGADTFHHLLHRAHGVPVVVLSAQDDEDLAVTSVQHGVQDYLVKGAFDGPRLGRTLRCAIARQALMTALDVSWREQLQLKQEFLADVSHELHAPLTLIHQYISIVLADASSPVTRSQHASLAAALGNVDQLHSIVVDLLESARTDSRKIGYRPGRVVPGEAGANKFHSQA